jgi:hypothetical protein
VSLAGCPFAERGEVDAVDLRIRAEEKVLLVEVPEVRDDLADRVDGDRYLPPTPVFEADHVDLAVCLADSRVEATAVDRRRAGWDAEAGPVWLRADVDRLGAMAPDVDAALDAFDAVLGALAILVAG